MYSVKQPKICKQVGFRLKQIRMSLGLSQLQFACEYDLSRSYLADLENGKRNISISTLDKILKTLNISYLEFFDNDLFKE